VIEDMESTIIKENLSTDNTSIYREVLKRQYQDLRYEIVDETIKEDKAEVKVHITVYDLYNSKIESENYMNENQTEFMNEENIFDEERYMKYRCIIYDILKLPAIVALDNITFGKYVKEIVQKYVKKPSASKIKVRVSKTIGDKDSIYIFISEDKTREFKDTVKMNSSKLQDMGMTMIGECNLGINLKKK
jgi:hypothetical protein